MCVYRDVYVHTQYGRLALESVLKSVLKGKSSLSNSEEYTEDFLDGMSIQLISWTLQLSLPKKLSVPLFPLFVFVLFRKPYTLLICIESLVSLLVFLVAQYVCRGSVVVWGFHGNVGVPR